MTTPFRNRDFHPVPPLLRPRRDRTAVRVIIVAGPLTLLLADTDPGLPSTRWWLTPGGGIDPGETPREAAVREIAEETGLRIASVDLLGPIAQRTVVHGYSDQILSQHEDFFLLRLAEPFERSAAGLTEQEQLTQDGAGWHRWDALDALDDPVWPANLAGLIALGDRPDQWPVALSEIEESTLPVG